MSIKIKQLLPHILGCLGFIALPILTAPHPDVSWGMFHSEPAKRDLLTYIPMLAFFYLSYFVLIPKFYFTKKYFAFCAIIFACFVFIMCLSSLILGDKHPPEDHKFDKEWHNKNEPPPQFEGGIGGRNKETSPPNPSKPPHEHEDSFIDFFELSHVLFLFLAVLFVSLALRINIQLKQAEADKLHAELAYLKTQINPHFLFNTLNSIYSLAITENADQTSTAVVKLSGMMRYVISEAHNDFVALEKEVNYLQDFIAMQKLRLGNTAKITPSVVGHFSGKKIAPLILVTFIENAFKHGVNAEAVSEILIKLELLGNELTLIVKNNKVKTSINELNKSGIGIQNTKNRLQLLYPDKHQLVINDGEKEYSVLLRINLS